MTEPELVAIDLDDDERELLVQALNEYFKSAKSGVPFLVLLFRVFGTEEFQALVWRLSEAVDNKEPLSPFDWSRALLLTEIAWASDLVGAGIEFAKIRSDEEVMPLLRSIQYQVVFGGGHSTLLFDNVNLVEQSRGLTPMTDSELVAIDLTDEERQLMLQGLNEYGGPVQRGVPLLLAPLLGLSTIDEFWTLTERLMEGIEAKESLSDLDWARALFLTEICWASNVIGAGVDFATSFRDEAAAPLVRSIQRKVSTTDRFVLLLDNARKIA
ncbi:MAG: hypothetical protein ACLPXZ_06240 [Mycobacterium sp.]